MFDAALVLGCVLGLMTVAGLIVGRLLSARPPDADDWLDAPVVGLSCLVLLLQALVTAGVPLRWGSWVAVGVLVVLAVIAWRQGRARGLAAAFPRGVVLLVVATLAAHAAGMAVAGLAFAGRAWGDQFNYTALAHYLTEYPLGTMPPLTAPVALVGTQYDHLRIGQSILQGWLAVVLPIEPRTAFEPLILLGPVLTGLALASAGRALAVRGAYVFATVGAVLPGLATLHLESFLSQALAVPLVLHFSALLARAATSGTLGAHVRVALVYTATAAIYPEYLPLAAAMLLTSLVACWPVIRSRTRHVVVGVVVLVLPFVLGVARGLTETFAFMTSPIMGSLYPYALQPEGLGRLWFGDAATLPGLATPTAAAGAILLALGLYGLVRLAEETLLQRRLEASRAPQLAIALCLLGVAAVPFATLARGSGYAYQFYKTLMGATPVLGWSIAYTVWRLLAQHAGLWRQRLALGVCAALAVAPALATADMSLAAARPGLPDAEHARRRQTTAIMLDSSLLQTAARLEASRGSVYLCATDGTWNAGHANAWLAYAARRSRVHALNPRLNDQNVKLIARRQQWFAPGAVPAADDLLVTGGSSGWLALGEPTLQPSSQPYAAVAWGTRTMGLCSASVGSTEDGHAALAVEVAGSDVGVVTVRPTTAILVFRDDEAAASRLTAVLPHGGGTPVSAAHGWAALALPLEAGAQESRWRRQRAGACFARCNCSTRRMRFPHHAS